MDAENRDKESQSRVPWELASKHFGKSSLQEIVSSLQSDPSPEAKKALEKIKSHSALSLGVIFEQLQRGTKLTLAECLQMEYRLAHKFLVRICSCPLLLSHAPTLSLLPCPSFRTVLRFNLFCPASLRGVSLSLFRALPFTDPPCAPCRRGTISTLAWPLCSRSSPSHALPSGFRPSTTSPSRRFSNTLSPTPRSRPSTVIETPLHPNSNPLHPCTTS